MYTRKFSSLLKVIASLIVISLFYFGIPNHVYSQEVVEVVIHHIEVAPIEGELAYDVFVYATTYDGSGNAIEGLGISNFVILEDSQEVTIKSVEKSEDLPINVVLVLDTSGSMARSMDSLKDAAQDFVQSLGANDQVAAITFDDEVTKVFDFTGDFSSARRSLETIDYKYNGGTCLYDAVYEAIALANVTTEGRKVIVVLTDGVDETMTEEKCSHHTAQDVTDRASNPGSQVPVFTIGLGKEVDEKVLTNIASETGGRFTSAADNSSLRGLFATIFKQLNTQNVIHFNSTNTPGVHSLVVQAIVNGVSDQDLRDFILPGLPPEVSIEAPVSGSEIHGPFKIVATIIERGIQVDNVTFEANGTKIWASSTPPYELEWDFGTDYGNKRIVVTAYDKSGRAINSSTINIKYNEEPTVETIPPTVEATAEAEASLLVTEEATQVSVGSIAEKNKNLIIIGSVSGGAIFLLVFVIVIARKRKINVEETPRLFDDATYDQIILSQPYAALIVESSDDPSMVGKDFNILKFPTTLGRSAENDIVFPKDTPVSRTHALIDKEKDRITISEILHQTKDGASKRPTYGTFVNDIQIEGPVILENEDEIRLGRRVRLRFKLMGFSDQPGFSNDEDVTFDDFNPPKFDSQDEETVDA